jgi:hypothetical protein
VPFAQRLGATISGFPSYTGVASGRHGFHRRPYRATPLFYPVFGPPGDAYDQPAYDAGPPPEQQAAAPPAGTDQYFGPETQPVDEDSGIQSYTAPSAARPEPSPDQPLFFIALTDNSVYTAVAYWVENGTLNYVTPQGRHNQVSLALIDRETTGRLNQGSKFQLHLPRA